MKPFEVTVIFLSGLHGEALAIDVTHALEKPEADISVELTERPSEEPVYEGQDANDCTREASQVSEHLIDSDDATLVRVPDVIHREDIHSNKIFFLNVRA